MSGEGGTAAPTAEGEKGPSGTPNPDGPFFALPASPAICRLAGRRYALALVRCPTTSFVGPIAATRSAPVIDLLKGLGGRLLGGLRPDSLTW